MRVQLLSESENTFEKTYFYHELWLFENGIQILNFCTKNADVGKIIVSNRYIFSKTLMVRYNCTKCLVYSISQSRDIGRG